MLLSIPVLWIWHLYYGTKKDAFTAAKLFSQVGVVVFVILFMVWDRAAVEEEAEHKALGNQKRNENVEFNNVGRNRPRSQGRDDEEAAGLLTGSNGERPSEHTNRTVSSSYIGSARRKEPEAIANDLMSSDGSSAPPHPSDDEDNSFIEERMVKRRETEGDEDDGPISGSSRVD